MGRIKHGANATGNRTRLYQVWIGMRARCADPKHISYKNYGAKGVYVDSRWNDFTVFRDWSYENGYVDPEPGARSKIEIDRVDPDKPYAPENCRWVTVAENRSRTAMRRKNTKWYSAWGELKTLGQWAEDSRCQCSYYVLRNRLNRGWEPERAISTPANKPGIKFR